MSVYDEVEIEDMTWDAEKSTFYYPCPCGDKFFITLDDLEGGEDIARCPSCSLRIRVIFGEEDLEKYTTTTSKPVTDASSTTTTTKTE